MTAPIRAADLVSDVLKRDAALVAVFERHSPHFAKLRNATLRRTMARLVTVEQAAAIAGVAVASLVRDLNDAVGITLQPEVVDAPAPASPPAAGGRRPESWPEVELDLREDMRAGREPFSRIMSAVGSLGSREALRLRTIFEPVPLYAVLAKRGLAHETVRHAPDDWSVWFWKAQDALEPNSAVTAVAAAGAASPEETWLDVRGLEPPEPMMRTLAALEHLPEGVTLVQVNVRTPQFLLPILAERGFEHQVDETEPDRVLVRIRRRL